MPPHQTSPFGLLGFGADLRIDFAGALARHVDGDAGLLLEAACICWHQTSSAAQYSVRLSARAAGAADTSMAATAAEQKMGHFH